MIREVVDEGRVEMGRLGGIVNEITETPRPEHGLTTKYNNDRMGMGQEKGNILDGLRSIVREKDARGKRNLVPPKGTR